MRAAIAIALLAAGCTPSADESAIYARAEIVRVCGDGVVGRDPVTKRLAWGNGWTRSLVAEGMTPDEVCDGKKERR